MKIRVFITVILGSILLSGCAKQNSKLEQSEYSEEDVQSEETAGAEKVSEQKQSVLYRKSGDTVEKYFWSDGRLQQTLATEEEIEVQQLDSLIENRFLVWQDSFSGDALDEQIWIYEAGKGKDDELQTYIAGDSNLSVKDGVLTIEARNEGERWTSSSIATKDTKHFSRGRIEAKIRFTNTTGQRGSFLTMGAWEDWPKAGEIDICDQYGNSDSDYYKLTSILRYQNQYNEPAESIRAEAHSFNNQLKDSEYHIFALEWDGEQIKIFIDEDNFATYNTKEYIYTSLDKKLNTKCNPFMQPQYLKLNLSVNDNVIPDAGNPIKMEVDWVRVYADKETTMAQQVLPSKLGIDYIYNVSGADRISESDLQWEGKAGEKIYLGVIYFPGTVVDRNYMFELDDEEIATITKDGVITVKKPGTVTVTVEDMTSGITTSRKLHIRLMNN